MKSLPGNPDFQSCSGFYCFFFKHFAKILTLQKMIKKRPLKKSQEEEHKMRKKTPTCIRTGANIVCAMQPSQASFLKSDRAKVLLVYWVLSVLFKLLLLL